MPTDVIGRMPYRMAFAGGWIDQPFLSRLNPKPPGSMVVVGIEPTMWLMERCGMATGTRKVAQRLWNGSIPSGRDLMGLVRELYTEENRNLPEPSGAQDMIGLIYPGVSRLDFDAEHEGGVFPKHVENCCDESVLAWIERVIHVIAVAPRPAGYNPLGIKNLDDRERIRELGQTGKDCYSALLARDADALGGSMNRCMRCWDELLPHVTRHPALEVDLRALLDYYQSRYAGAMYSGCGGGYLYVVSESNPVPGAFKVRVRRNPE